MLIITRKVSQQFVIGDDIVVTVVRIQADSVKLGFDAPRKVEIWRREIKELVDQETRGKSHDCL